MTDTGRRGGRVIPRDDGTGRLKGRYQGIKNQRADIMSMTRYHDKTIKQGGQ